METLRMSRTYTIVTLLLISLHFSNAALSSSVLDSDGNELLKGTNYYIVPLLGSGGGLGLMARDVHTPCPLNVGQLIHKTQFGLPLKVIPQGTSNVIRLSTDVNLAFNAATTCVQPTVWRLGDVESITKRRYVRSAGVVGRPGPETVRNWFKIERSAGGGTNGYKFVYCPSVCHACKVTCGDVGVFVEGSRRWLGIGFGGEPLVISFKKRVV